MLAFVLGLMLGALIGLFVAALVNSSGGAD